MTDTTIIVQKVADNSLLLDSINRKLSTLQYDQLHPPTNRPVALWIPLLAAIVGGLLVWAGQAIERTMKRKNEKRNSLLEIYSYCRKLEAAMKNHYRELAMAKLHVEYWWYCYTINPGPTPEQSRAYEEHLKSQAFAREIERSIGNTKADFIGHVRKFEMIEQLPEGVQAHLEVISNLSNARAKTYDKSIDYNTLRNETVYADEEQLRNTYYKNLDSFKTINEILKKKLP